MPVDATQEMILLMVKVIFPPGNILVYLTGVVMGIPIRPHLPEAKQKSHQNVASAAMVSHGWQMVKREWRQHKR